MLKDFTWRKTPTDIFSNLKMQSLMHTLKAPYKHVVALVYAQMYMDADNDGLVSVDSGEYAYAFALKSPAMVDELTAILAEKGFISVMGERSFLIMDFETAEVKKERGESAEDRRARVAKKICEKTASDCDKNSKNVTENAKNAVLHDKNAENVTEQREKRGEERRLDESRGDESEENVQSELTLQETMAVDAQIDLTLQETMSAQDLSESADTEEIPEESEISPGLLKKLETYGVSLSDLGTLGVFERFFAAHNSPGTALWDTEAEVTALALLVCKCVVLSEPKSSPKLVARTLCGAFGAVVREVPELRECRCLPTELLSGPVWAKVLEKTREKLSPGILSAKIFDSEIKKAVEGKT